MQLEQCLICKYFRLFQAQIVMMLKLVTWKKGPDPGEGTPYDGLSGRLRQKGVFFSGVSYMNGVGFH